MDRAIRSLIAEDDFHTRWPMKRLMEPHIRCDIAVNGDAVLSAFDISQEDGTPYNIVLLDLGLPGGAPLTTIDGIRCREKSRQISGMDRIKFVAIAPPEISEEALPKILSQCEGHISKPVKKGDFLGQLHSMGFLQS